VSASINIIERIYKDKKARVMFFILFKSNSYLSYLIGTRPDTWHDFSNAIKKFIETGDIDSLNGNLSGIIKGIFAAWCTVLKINSDDLDSRDTSKQFEYLEQLSYDFIVKIPEKDIKPFGDCIKYSFSDINNLPANGEQIEDFNRFHQNLRSFYELETKAIRFFESQSALEDRLKDQYRTISSECYQEIYHSFSHLALDTHSNLSEKLKNAKSHVNRAHLDFVKVNVSIKGALDNKIKELGKVARFIEMQHIGHQNKQTVLRLYLTVFDFDTSRF